MQSHTCAEYLPTPHTVTWWNEPVVFAVYNGSHQKIFKDTQDFTGYNVAKALVSVL